MKKTNKIFLFSLLAILFIGCQNQEYKTEIIPIESLFKNPKSIALKLSPSGNKIAHLKSWNNRLNVFVKNFSNNTEIQITHEKDASVESFFWISETKVLYLIDKYSNDNKALICVSLDGTNNKELTDSKNFTTYVINVLPEFEDEIIIQTNERDQTVFDVYRLNLLSGKKIVIGKNPGNVTHWLTDNNGKLRISVKSDGVNNVIQYRKTERENFKEVKTVNFTTQFYPVLFTKNNKNLYVLSNEGSNRTALIEYDVHRNYETKVLYEHPEVDVEYIYYSEKKQEVTGVSYLTWKREFTFWDEDRAEIQKNLERQIPNMELNKVSTNKNEDKLLIKASSDKSYGTYYLYDVTKDTLIKISEISPWLNDYQFSDMKPIRFKSRDGLTINGYLTLPQMEITENLPAVILPHGGPWYRDKWSFNKKVQFLANRGYAVLQINFRGSVGYGKNFWQAGFKEWGGAIQNDITDGTNWLIKQGIIDKNRIAIMGSSFGGFSVLEGVSKNPNLYQCGISQAGITDLFAFLETIPPTWSPFRAMLYEMIGNPVEDEKMIESQSPLFNVDKIKVPLFIAHGANDSKVKKTDVDLFIEKLNENGVKVKYLLKDNEGHGFKKEENRIEYYKEVESFLAKYLKGRIEK
ncbi:MAG: S9 family peptidase [Melioribacteraceae bacterium]|nr:S9 family peptidase [Melioribacteraceae bacterium]